jgi:hypothetical protein
MSLEDLMHRAGVWRGGLALPQAAVASGHPLLDAELAGNGWPLGALTEILMERAGAGELTLVVPALARLTREGRWLAFIAPPYLPYAPALARAGIELAKVLWVQPKEAGEALWAAEQALRSGACGAVLLWANNLEDKHLRRLQLAAEHGGSLGFLFRTLDHAKESSPAALRLGLKAAGNRARRIEVSILKRRGGWPVGPIVVEVDDAVGGPSSTAPRA